MAIVPPVLVALDQDLAVPRDQERGDRVPGQVLLDPE
jgi:hypothetical protein